LVYRGDIGDFQGDLCLGISVLSCSVHPMVFSVLRPVASSSYRYFKANPHLLSPIASFDTNGMPQNADTHRNGLISGRSYRPF